MKESTRIALENNINNLSGKHFQKEDVKGISWQTFAKYAHPRKVVVHHEEVLTPEAVLNMLNSYGDGSYCSDVSTYTYNRDTKEYIEHWDTTHWEL